MTQALDVATQNDQTECNRWLSRGAREILRRHLKSWIQSHPTKPTTTTDDWTVWQMLDSVLPSQPYPSNCPLLPHRDVLRRDEENAHEIPAETTRRMEWALPYRSNSHRTAHPKRRWAEQRVRHAAPHWFQCGYCGKTFLTRFYLDRHMMMTHHRPDNNTTTTTTNKSQTLICPAVDWCAHWSATACYDMAVALDPHYAPGSGGWHEDDAKRVARQVLSQATPHCSDAAIHAAADSCRSMIRECFFLVDCKENDTTSSSDLAVYLRETLCQPMTCAQRLQRRVLHVYHWQVIDALWFGAAQHPTDNGFVAAAIIIVLGVALTCWHKRATRPVARGKRLLRKSSSSSRPLGWRRDAVPLFPKRKVKNQ